jgi:hypothetical protein
MNVLNTHSLTGYVWQVTPSCLIIAHNVVTPMAKLYVIT